MSPTQLPYDLERTIIEYAAETDQPMALKLMLVSREVKRWIEPILYRHIKLRNSSQTDAFIHTLESLHPESPFFANTIKSISFTHGVTFHQAARILSVCSNITSLLAQIEFSRRVLDITLDDIDDIRRFLAAQSPALRRLSVTLQPFFLCPDPSFRAPILRSLTHLSVLGSSSEHCHRWTWTGFNALDCLTHFAFEIDTSTPLQVIYNLIPRFPALLRICLVIISVKSGKMPLERYLMDNKEVQQMILGKTDGRIVVGTTEEIGPQDMESWAQGMIPVERWDDAIGDRETWDRAESAVSNRKRRYPINIVRN
ncbi:hypothetical protein P691DRAFT_807395 [Macrolepiota fuliginosa MF-IS2]|uniref:Uncharacterized protein n=1 Tax=Macrolepiota fuliginosa MF-IS2 TaxID=1400762 RepID=A0A9P5X4L9_9AGAR|nr:hypothetical protein P691DRAFT_807395 [Macrolepiota fuliginosa MF-IS2]